MTADQIKKINVKEWMNRGWKIERLITALLNEKTDALKKLSGITPTQESCKNISYFDYDRLIDKQIDELYQIKCEILHVIAQVDDNTLRTLLTLRYTRFYTWDKIADDMYYSRKHVIHTLHPKALAAAQKVIECNHGAVL